MEPDELSELYCSVRAASQGLIAQLSDADATAQSMPDASPAKWHLAHSTWFFETMVLTPHLPGYRSFDERYNFLFNSYYETVGARHPRPARGLLTRPSLETVKAYREHVDASMARLLALAPSPEATALTELGCHHEQQHQELLLTDILHLFAQNPLRPVFKAPESLVVNSHLQGSPQYLDFEGGLIAKTQIAAYRCLVERARYAWSVFAGAALLSVTEYCHVIVRGPSHAAVHCRRRDREYIVMAVTGGSGGIIGLFSQQGRSRFAHSCCRFGGDELAANFASQTPMRRVGLPEDIADVALWLATDGARFITGQSLVVDGGFTIPKAR
jgi:hypothetical protein